MSEKHQGNFLRPAVDVLENDDELLLVGDLPGLSKEQIQLRVEADQLLLEARGERVGYRRSFNLPDQVQRDAIAAELADGVLRVHLPKHEAAKTKVVDIQIA